MVSFTTRWGTFPINYHPFYQCQKSSHVKLNILSRGKMTGPHSNIYRVCICISKMQLSSISNNINWFICWRVSLAEAHCKLSLRTRVLEEDAVIAVLLCESSVTLKHGSYWPHLKTKEDNTATKKAIKCARMYFQEIPFAVRRSICARSPTRPGVSLWPGRCRQSAEERHGPRGASPEYSAVHLCLCTRSRDVYQRRIRPSRKVQKHRYAT